MMSRIAFFCVVLISLAAAVSFASCIPGQDIRAGASVVSYQKTQMDAVASISYLDTSGNPVSEVPLQIASVQVEIPTTLATSGKVTSFVLPNQTAPVYFTVARSFYQGPSLAGKCVKLAGKVRSINSALYLDDGSTLRSQDSINGRWIGVSAPLPLRTDLLTVLPQDGSFIIIQGVCRQESSNCLSLLPLSDSAIVKVQ